jgi:EAL domain-containing protein (putative c-di-GMP-specific phosphodiesterase class I)
MIVVQKSAEIKLMELLSMIRDPAGWTAIHFNLDRLMEQFKSDYQVKIAINLIHDMLKGYEGGIYQLVDNGIIVMAGELEKHVHDKLIFQLRYLYMDDPIAYYENGEENADFATSYDLRREWQPFMDMCTRRMAVLVRKTSSSERATKEITADDASDERRKLGARNDLSASKLADIERDLDRMDIQRVLRRQPICAVLPNHTMRRVFDELYVHISHLRQVLKSDVDFFSDRWLFKYFTGVLDQIMLDTIVQNPVRFLESPVSVNMNVETIISHRFDQFDNAIKPSAKVAMVVEIPVVDVFADMVGFTTARKHLQKLGYRVCLDGVSTDNFTMLDREKLGVDLVKLQWNADVESDLNSPHNQSLIKSVQAMGSNRVILCRCDNKQAVQYGQALGISLFQGRYIDSVLNPNAKIEN